MAHCKQMTCRNELIFRIFSKKKFRLRRLLLSWTSILIGLTNEAMECLRVCRAMLSIQLHLTVRVNRSPLDQLAEHYSCVRSLRSQNESKKSKCFRFNWIDALDSVEFIWRDHRRRIDELAQPKSAHNRLQSDRNPNGGNIANNRRIKRRQTKRNSSWSQKEMNFLLFRCWTYNWSNNDESWLNKGGDVKADACFLSLN